MDENSPMEIDQELDAILHSADDGLLEAIESNLDLDAGFNQLMREIPEVARRGGQRSAAGAGPHGVGPLPLPVDRTPVAAARLTALTRAGHGGAPVSWRSRLVLFGAALLLAINAGILVNLVHNDADDARPPAAGIMPSPNSLPDGPDTSPFNPRSKTQPIIILGKPDAFVPLGGVAARAGIGGNPVIRYLWSSGGGPVIQVSGIPEGTGISYSGASMEQQSCPECANDTSAAPPFPGHAADTSYATKIALDGVGGRIVLRAERAPSRGFIVVLVTWIPDLE